MHSYPWAVVGVFPSPLGIAAAKSFAIFGGLFVVEYACLPNFWCLRIFLCIDSLFFCLRRSLFEFVKIIFGV